MKKIIGAVKNTILCMASLHLGIILIHYFQSKDLRLINAFHILDLQIFYSQIENGVMNFVLSWLLIGAVFLSFYLLANKKIKS